MFGWPLSLRQVGLLWASGAAGSAPLSLPTLVLAPERLLNSGNAGHRAATVGRMVLASAGEARGAVGVAGLTVVTTVTGGATAKAHLPVPTSSGTMAPRQTAGALWRVSAVAGLAQGDPEQSEEKDSVLPSSNGGLHRCKRGDHHGQGAGAVNRPVKRSMEASNALHRLTTAGPEVFENHGLRERRVDTAEREVHPLATTRTRWLEDEALQSRRKGQQLAKVVDVSRISTEEVSGPAGQLAGAQP